MNTGKNYNKLVYGSGITKLTAQISTVKSWLQHPKMKEINRVTKKPKIVQYMDFLSSMVINGSTLDDYITLELYKKTHKERKLYLTGKKQHKFLDEVNDKSKTNILKDKNEFAKYFSGYIGRDIFKLELDESNVDEAIRWLHGRDIVFAKPSNGGRGEGVTRLTVKNNAAEELINYCLNNGFDLLEEAIVQHKDLNALYPDAINTIRFMTFVENGDVKIIGTRIRMGNGGYVDNAAAGGVFATIDVDTGEIDSVAFNKLGEKFEHHPITKHPIKGFKIPHWEEVIKMCKDAALEIPDVRSIGWDVGITEDGPLLIEGNDRWCRVLWQMPAEEGLYHLIKE